jgi:hypothetical protein
MTDPGTSPTSLPFAEDSLLDAFQSHSFRSSIANHGMGAHPVQLQLVEAKMQDGLCCFSDVSLPTMYFINPEAQLARDRASVCVGKSSIPG